MKRAILIALLAAALPVMAVEKAVEQTVTATVTAEDNGNGPVVKVVQIGGCGKGDATKCGAANGCKPGCATMAAAGAPCVLVSAGDGESEGKCRVLTRVIETDNVNRGWLGVALGVVSEKSSDGDTVEKTQSVEVMNVVKDSPAERSGLLEGDQVVSLNGVTIETVADLAKAIGDLGPGGVASFVIDRDGAIMNISATLESPRTGDIEWLYTPDMSLIQSYTVAPQVLSLPQGGGAHMLQLDNLNLDDLDDSMSIIAKVLGSLDDSTTELSFEEGKKTVRIHVDRSGDLLDIEQAEGGPIVVTREAGGQVTENEYADEAALEAGDADAFDLFRQHQPSAVWIGKNGQGAFDMSLMFGQGDDFDANAVRKQIQLQLEGMGDINQRIEDITARIEGLDGLNIDPAQLGTANVFIQKMKATRSFKVNPEGQIELTIRKGDTEVVRVFADEADLEAREPDTYQQYRQVMDAEIEP